MWFGKKEKEILKNIHLKVWGLDQEFEDIRQRLRIAIPTHRLAWVYGGAIQNSYDGLREWKTQIHCEPQWVGESDEVQFHIHPMMPIRDIMLKVNEPFLITDIMIGNVTQSCTSYGATREWICSDVCTPGNIITVRVKWFAHPSS